MIYIYIDLHDPEQFCIPWSTVFGRLGCIVHSSSLIRIHGSVCRRYIFQIWLQLARGSFLYGRFSSFEKKKNSNVCSDILYILACPCTFFIPALLEIHYNPVQCTSEFSSITNQSIRHICFTPPPTLDP